MKLNEGRNRSVALLQYGKKAKLLLGNGVPEDYIITACKFCGDISNATNIAIMVKQWLKYAPEEIKGTIQTLSLEEWSNKLADVIENRKVPHCFIQAGSWKVGEFDNYEDCQLFPVQNNWCICKDPKWIGNYHNKDSRLLIIYNPNLPTKFKYMVAELEHNGIISFWDIENSSTDFQQFPEYTSILPKVIKDYLFKVSLSNNPYKAYNKMMESKNYKNMKKNVKRINESQLRAIVAESVKKVLTEATDDLPEAIEMQDKFAEAILFKLRELETFWWEKHKTPYPYSREVLKKALKGYDWEHKQGGEGLEYCGFER